MMIFHPISRSAFPLVAAIVAAVAAGCGDTEDSEKVAPQVAAKVNGHAISMREVNSILARSQNGAPESAGKAQRDILDRLIDRQLAQQRAIKLKLDHSASMMRAVEAARSEILARAYLEQVAAAASKPTAEEAKKYYLKHPELFASRRIFDLEEIVVVPNEELAGNLRKQIAEARSLEDIVAWLKTRNAEISTNRVVRAAEEIPLELLPQLRRMESGEIRLFETPGHLHVFRVIATRDAPMNEETALPLIQQFLSNQRSAEAVALEMKALKDRANIVYVGKFAKDLTTTDGRATAGAKGPSTAARPIAQHSENGVRGLE